MSLSISQIVASSYDAVLANKRRPENQWAESAFLRELQRQGAIKPTSLGKTIEVPLDYRANSGAAFIATDLEDTGSSKTDVITAASYAIAQLMVPVLWSTGDDAKNPSENQKIALVASLLENGIESHDNLIEQALFSTSTNGFLGLQNIVKADGQGSPGGIDAATETFWRNPTDTYNDETDMVAAMTSLFNTCAKGSGSKLSPKIIVSGADAQATFESTQQANQRYVDSDDLKAGFKTLAFKTARYVYSPFGGSSLYFLNPSSFNVIVSKQYFRDKGPEINLPNAMGTKVHIYSALQAVTDNKSRLGVLALNS